MDKSQKKLLAVIVSVVLIFTIGITALSLFQMPDFRADNSAQMTIGEAKAMVLEYAQVQESDAAFTKQEADIRRGTRQYDIEFTDGTSEYKFKVDAHTGKVISYVQETVD